ncbi:MAG: VWA domain-containing protein, partial [Muribaculaceae bacterium]|nr:VWA domain-containing protein [Muribaculaceae bacterium]
DNDKVGVIFFSDKIEKFIPPKKGRKHILLIIREIINFEPESNGTDIDIALKFLTNAIKKRCTAFLISDFIDDHDYFKSMSIANKKHDLAAIQVYDRRDAEMPDVGLIRIRDMESGRDRWIDTSSRSVRKAYAKGWYERQQRLSSTVTRSGVDLAQVTTDEDFVKALLGLFRRRGVK